MSEDGPVAPSATAAPALRGIPRRPAMVLIDVDGTLVDSVPDLAFSVDRMMEQLGLPGRGESRVRDWVGNYGSDGYVLMAWNASSDLSWMPLATAVIDQGSRYRWSSGTSETRAPEDPGQTTRRAAQWVHSSSLRFHLTFNAAYSGVLHLYALDWDGSKRRETVYVDEVDTLRG